MAGMGDGYVGTAQDAVRIRRLEKQREAERRKIQELKTKSAAAGGRLASSSSAPAPPRSPPLNGAVVKMSIEHHVLDRTIPLCWSGAYELWHKVLSMFEKALDARHRSGAYELWHKVLSMFEKALGIGLSALGQLKHSALSEILETAFKKETVGLVTREQYVEKRVNIRSKLRKKRRKSFKNCNKRFATSQRRRTSVTKKEKRRVKGDSRLSFVDDIENESDEDDAENKENQGVKRLGQGKLGKDPSVETSFLPDRMIFQGERGRGTRGTRKIEETLLGWNGHRRVIQVRKGDTIGEFLRAVQQQLAPEFREVRTTSVENLLYVKEDLIIPHQHSFYELIINKARGKSGPLFHFDVHEDVRTIADATIEKDESHAGKVVERHWYEKNKHIFPASRWEIYDPTKKWERYTIHGD
uniref:FAM50A/XAP5 C-terminal domain-containing protein n=1 Tax=Ananas comosus var. bracteatus TaxID=296719 RepID=A0A6V7QCF7_ANACO|nr:unnamed protein product [Ananas comosus var. bracteatus]